MIAENISVVRLIVSNFTKITLNFNSQGPYSQNFFMQIRKNLRNFNLDFRTNFTSKIGILLLIM
jgi:hypothetical protein